VVADPIRCVRKCITSKSKVSKLQQMCHPVVFDIAVCNLTSSLKNDQFIQNTSLYWYSCFGVTQLDFNIPETFTGQTSQSFFVIGYLCMKITVPRAINNVYYDFNNIKARRILLLTFLNLLITHVFVLANRMGYLRRENYFYFFIFSHNNLYNFYEMYYINWWNYSCSEYY